MDDESTQDEGQGLDGGAAGESAAGDGVVGAGVDAEGGGVQAAGAMGEAGVPDPGEHVEQAQPEDVASVLKEGQEGLAPDFEQLSGGLDGSKPAALSLLYDLDLPVAIELGRTRLSVQDILALGRGSVVQLDRQAGEPVDVYVGDRRFAEGEVVIVGEQFGVRITRIVNTAPVTAVSAG